MKPDEHVFVSLDEEEIIAAVEGANVESKGEGELGIRRTDKIASGVFDQSKNNVNSFLSGAEGGNRTRTVLLLRDFKSRASTNSATSARVSIC